MKNMKSIFVGLALTASFAFAGCGSDVVKEFETAVDKICACEDTACATKAMETITNMKKGDKPSDSDMEKIAKLASKMTQCMTDIAMKEAKAGAK